ncbi:MULTISPECIES: hypothetical protein [Lachnospiraceae]|uniref:hypothetical protein n=1 Tax=Lachnospiraceae TaxID=186803 RepID=UPI001FA98ED3|nr:MULTISPECIES: hypothetical protein [Lachnospiraceae]
MMHKNFMHEHKSKMGVPPTHEVLYRLQISQHQLQKDVTHQLSRFLVNRRDDEADFSDMVHIYLNSNKLQEQIADLISRKESLNNQYVSFKQEIKELELIQQNLSKYLKQDAPEIQRSSHNQLPSL